MALSEEQVVVQPGLVFPGDLCQMGRAKAMSEGRQLETSQSLIHPEVRRGRRGPGDHIIENIAPPQSRHPNFTHFTKYKSLSFKYKLRIIY